MNSTVIGNITNHSFQFFSKKFVAFHLNFARMLIAHFHSSIHLRDFHYLVVEMGSLKLFPWIF